MQRLDAGHQTRGSLRARIPHRTLTERVSANRPKLRGRWQPLLILLVIAASVRLQRIDRPLADHLSVKQVYVANKARAIARRPFNPLRNELDFLDARGYRVALTEEIPLYTSALALAYRCFGERDWLGRGLSLVGTLIAVAAFHDLARREHGARRAFVATLLLASTPLLIFYGQATLPDPWMLACMLLAASCYRRHLDGGSRWWVAVAGFCGLAAAVFKCFGLMVLVPLAAMECRQGGLRRLATARFLGLASVMIVPVGLWMVAVFANTPNPILTSWTGNGSAPAYFVFQDPSVLLRRELYLLFGARFLARDCGPVLAGLIGLGVVGVLGYRLRPGPLGGWSVMGLAFYVLLAPKLPAHDYYELMMLPAAALWGTYGWENLTRIGGRIATALGRGDETGVRLGAEVLVVAVVLHSPWVNGAFFRIDEGKLIVARRLAEHCPTSGRVVIAGPGIELPVIVHYSRREGWALSQDLLPDWRERLPRYRAQGATHLAVYLDPKAAPAEHSALAALKESLRLVEQEAGPWSRRGEHCEYWIFAL
jgi:hypothetical protein